MNEKNFACKVKKHLPNMFIVVGLVSLVILTIKMINNGNVEQITSKIESDGLSRPIFKNGVFNNPWPTWKMASSYDLFRWKIFYKDRTNLPSDSKILDKDLPVHQISDDEIKKFCEEDTSKKFKVIWIGHSTSLINFENTIILMDPIFGERASPVQFAGPIRFRPVPITIDRIPRVDAVIISHNHYDHLDHGSIMALYQKFGKDQKEPVNWFVGRGTGEWFKNCGITNNVHEFDWWENKKFKELEFIFTPAQHWSTRSINDRNKALWGGWIIRGNSSRIYFAGDTGYCSVFEEIGKKYGPFDYSFIPIGAYEPRWMMSPQHVDPEEAVKIHMDVRSNKTFAIHWGTFALASEYYMEPKQKLSEMLEKFAQDKNNFITLQHGNTFFIMNDLKQLISNEKRLNISSDRIEMITFDTNMNSVYLSDHNQIYEIPNDKDVESIFELKSEFLSNNQDNKLVLFQFLTESNNICLINSKGDLNLLNVLTKTVEEVGCLSDGLSAAQWSPDQELLALVTSSKALVLMTKDFDILNEQKISTDNVVESEFVNVGWGAYETQFKGSVGKHAIKEKTEDQILPWDDRESKICWRPDGEYFVVHFIDSKTNSRKFQVFNREGAVHSTIEKDINVLDSAIDWKYSKSLITTAIHRHNKHEVIFFERNGLAHGGFLLPFPIGQMKINSLSWNLDSSILCIWAELADSFKESDYKSIVQLWSMSNYHWYLKQSIDFDLKNRISAVCWDPEDSFKLHLFTETGQYVSYKYGWFVNCCKPVDGFNGSIALINSCDALITPFKNKVIPPPMSLHKITCPKPINKLVWSSFNMDFLVYLLNGEIQFYKYDRVKDEIQNGLKLGTYGYELTNQVKLSLENMKDYVWSVQHIVWTGIDKIVVIYENKISGFNFAELKLVSSQDKNIHLEKIADINLNFDVLNTYYNIVTNHLALQSTNGTVFKYVKKDSWILINSDIKFPQTCPNFSISSIGTENNLKEICVGLSQFYRLYADGVELANNCTSFYVHDQFLLYTDHTNTLKFIDLNKLHNANKKINEESFRKLERGAKLLIALNTDTGCILQMPRGNLELIHPRTLVVSKLKSFIDNMEYLNAVEIMRKHRVNMNILCDHNLKNFLDNLTQFVHKINNVNLINLFLTELSDEDTTLSFFKDHYPERNIGKKEELKPIKSTKIFDVCTKLIEICESIDKNKFYLVILSCFAKMKELEKALYRVIQSKDTGQASIDEGLRHLLYIVDVNELFDVALGTYDFDLVLMVAEKSQKDPKEYLPFLNELKKLEENYRKFKIDFYLKRFKKALQSIIKCGNEYNDEIIKLVDNHKLYSECLRHYSPSEEMFKTVSKLFANHLTEKKYYEEAGLILTRAEQYEQASELFLKSASWEMFINVCLKLKLPSHLYSEKLTLIIEKLKSENRYLECSHVYESYMNDTESAILNLINGTHWSEALTLIHKSNRFDFLETNLLPSLKSNQQELVKTLEQYEKKFLEHKQRLDEVREEKAKKKEREMMDEFEDENRHRDDLSMSEISNSTFDTQSQAGSTRSSASTIASTFSSKSKRKNRQKKTLISLKKGSPFEDLALIQELSDTMTYVYKQKDSVFSLSKSLLLFNLNDLCVQLQGNYEKAIDLIEKMATQIWNYQAQNDTDNFSFQTFQQNILADLTDFSKLEFKYRFPPETVSKRSWKLHFYE
ncbi:elongator complex 1 [Brachionus plicatilis]|uniref:Elongator complex 1 n=1 Tax=Brachionus plicatilis TaxID=10195 RepID=A0A3M7RS33_BRAPC|nr:elongator complex 1 [Brachionus plicatilis]